MAATYGPKVTFDLPSGSDEAQEIVDALGLDHGNSQSWGKHSGEMADDLRSTVGHALAEAYDGCLDPWLLMPRRVEYDGARVTVTLVPHSSEYDGTEEIPEPAPSPEQRVKATLREYHHELGANEVATSDILAETQGEQATIRQALESLDRRGEIYQPSEGYYRLTGE